jgi:hypothetical protein
MGIEEKVEQPIRIVLPKLYDFLNIELEKFHIHSYDYQANMVEKRDGYEIILRFGEGFTQTLSQFFKYEVIEEKGQDLLDFIQLSGESCKNILVADYFKMMKM